MLGEIPPNIHHGWAREVASHQPKVGFPWFLSAIIIMTSNCKLILTCEILSRGILPKVKYQTYFSSECWMEILSTEQEMLGGNNFHPASTRYATHCKLGYSSTSKAVVPLHPYLWIFLNIYINQNSTIPSINGRVKFSFRARCHVGW